MINKPDKLEISFVPHLEQVYGLKEIRKAFRKILGLVKQIRQISNVEPFILQLTSGITGFAIALSQIYRCPTTFRSPSAQSPVHAFVRPILLWLIQFHSIVVLLCSILVLATPEKLGLFHEHDKPPFAVQIGNWNTMIKQQSQILNERIEI